MRSRFPASAGDGVEGLGIRRVRDGRAETAPTAIVEDAPEYSSNLLSLRYCPYDWRTVWGAAALGQSRILATMLRRGEPVDRQDADGRTPLMYAVDYAQPASLCLLLEQGANPNATDHSGKTPVFFARGPRAITLVTILVNGGACLAHTDNQGYSCLFYALVHGERRLSVFLEQSGATCGFPEAVLRGDTTLARSLPTIVNLDAALPNGETFLTQTVRQGDFALTALLLDRGANPNVANVQGLTPLDVAAMSSRGRIVRLLLDSGATPALIQFTDHSTLRQWAGLPD